MKNLIKLVLILFLPVVIFSCTKDENAESCKVSDTQAVLMGEEEAFQTFSKILSSAVYNEQTLRSFLKAEALRQIDKDYDVFYPWVRDAQVDEDRTLRDVLKQYDEENRLEAIEMALPLLTIYVPDWSWLDEHCFSVNSWDVSAPEVAVSYSTDASENTIYLNGEQAGCIPAGMFPDHPVVIVKENERIERGKATRASDGEYTFVDPEYDGSGETLTKTVTDTCFINVSPPVNYFHCAYADTKVRAAYSIAEAANMPQRDYVYYDMTATQSTGFVNTQFVENIKFFKLSPTATGLYDNPSPNGTDYSLDGGIKYPGEELTKSQMSLMKWAEGALEMVFYVRLGGISVVKHKSVQIKRAFHANRVYYMYQPDANNNIIWRCYYTETQYLVPQWIMAELELFNWDLLYYPYKYEVSVEEEDHSALTSRQITNSYYYAANVSASAQNGQCFKTGYGHGNSALSLTSMTTTESYYQYNDSFGSFFVDYEDQMITTTPGYYIYPKIYSSDANLVDVIIYPKKIN